MDEELSIEKILEKLYVTQAVLWLNPLSEQVEVVIGDLHYQYCPHKHLFRYYPILNNNDRLKKYAEV